MPGARSAANELGEAVVGRGSVLVALDRQHPAGVRYPEPDVHEVPDVDEVDDEPAKAEVMWVPVPSQPVRPRDKRSTRPRRSILTEEFGRDREHRGL